MRVGVRLVQYLGSPREVVALARMAEEAGVAEVWVPHDPFMTHAWTIATAIAEATDRVVVGSIGTNPYTTDPSEIAAHLATLDALSGGRAALGLGLHTTSMVEWVGLDAADVVARTRAAVSIVRALLRGETVTGEGPYLWGTECSLRFGSLRYARMCRSTWSGSERSFFGSRGRSGTGRCRWRRRRSPSPRSSRTSAAAH